MNTKNLLYQVKKEQKEINILRDQIRQVEASMLPQAIRYDAVKVQTSPDDPMIRRIEILEEMEKDLDKKLQMLIKKRRLAVRLIYRLKDSRQRQVLLLYYTDERELKMYQVADIMGYTQRWTHKIYKEALKNLE